MCLPVQVLIGNAQYNCTCVRYFTPHDLLLTFGLSAGFGCLLIIIIIIIATVACCRCRKKSSQQPDHRDTCDDNVSGPIELVEDDRYYCSIPDTAANNSGNEYCRAGPVEPDDNKEYATIGPAQEPSAPTYSHD